LWIYLEAHLAVIEKEIDRAAALDKTFRLANN